MRHACWLVWLALAVMGCASSSEDRVRNYNEDGLYLFQRGDYAGARQTFEAALVLKPEDQGLLYNLGQCYDRLGDNAKAERNYNDCLKHNPNHRECRHALAMLLVHQNRRPEAVAMVQDWLNKEPKLAAAYVEDGWLWAQVGDLSQAQTRFQQALELDPHDIQALTELGRTYEGMNRPDRAMVLYERALAQDPKQTELSGRVQFLLAKGVHKPHPD